MRRAGVTFLCAILVALVAATTASAAVTPYGTDDYGGFRDVLPSGTNGRTNIAELAAFLATGARPAHNDDQLAMYANLVFAAPGLTSGELGSYFKDSRFGVREGDVERTYSPRPGLTILRDKGFGVPHIYGDTRGAALFGQGYAAAEDRLFFMDVLRHLGRAEVSSFAGGAPGNRALDRDQWRIAPYTEADLQRQIDQLDDLYGPLGSELQALLGEYIAGINAYINEAKLNPEKMPGEYAAIGKVLGPDPWKGTDVVATASLVGGIFGFGGGRELTQGKLLQDFRKRFGDTLGTSLWKNFRSAEDPEAPVTVRGKSFPYETPPGTVAPGSVALPDVGSVRDEPVVTSSGSGSPLPSPPSVPGLPALKAVQGMIGALPKAMSNALVVSGAESATGRPLAVFGPQTGYFQPQILMEQDVHAPGIDARGAAFPGVNVVVQLGHGRDYAWSATSAGQDNVDTFAVDLCNQDGSAPTLDSTSYRFRSVCVPMETLERTNSWSPTPADQTPSGTETLRAYRTKLGTVIARATINGVPVAYTSLRSTYMHEADSALGFAAFNDPAQMRNAHDFQVAASKIGYTFNWLYVDDKDIAYFNSGNNPVRAANTDPLLPVRGEQRFEWRNYNPDRLTADYTPFAQHPQVINQNYLTSWNNKQARGYAASDTNIYSSIYRSQPLDDRIEQGIRGTKKMTLTDLVNAMEDAGTVDLRGDKVLPWALRVLGTPADPQLGDAVTKLQAWMADGAHRRDRDHNGTYEHSEAIRIMDAWWPRWVRAQFEPALGPELYERMLGVYELDNGPNTHGAHTGSAYQAGWYGFVQKDLRVVLGINVPGKYAKTFCGDGALAACRTTLEGSLTDALANDSPEQLYSGDQVCNDADRSGDQTCFDAILHRPLGGATQPLIPWINRPTYQQIVEVQGHRPR